MSPRASTARARYPRLAAFAEHDGRRRPSGGVGDLIARRSEALSALDEIDRLRASLGTVFPCEASAAAADDGVTVELVLAVLDALKSQCDDSYLMGVIAACEDVVESSFHLPRETGK